MDIQGLVQESVTNSVTEGFKAEIRKVVSKWVRKGRAATLNRIKEMVETEYDRQAEDHTTAIVSRLVGSSGTE